MVCWAYLRETRWMRVGGDGTAGRGGGMRGKVMLRRLCVHEKHEVPYFFLSCFNRWFPTLWFYRVTNPTTQAPTTVQPTTEEGTEESSVPRCKVEAYSGVYYWSSPDFGAKNYPNNFRCGIRGRSSSVSGLTFLIDDALWYQNLPSRFKAYLLCC